MPTPSPQARTTGVTVDLQSPNQHQQHTRKPSKAYHVVPQDDAWLGLQEPLASSPSNAENEPHERTRARAKSTRTLLATSRVARDKLMRVMEDLILKEAELASAYELFAYTRIKSLADHDEIVDKLRQYDSLLQEAKQQEEHIRSTGVDAVLKTPQEKERWEHTQVMVRTTLPELLVRLEESIDVNGAKIRNIQDRLEDIRAQRLAVREEIADKEQDIALALASSSSSSSSTSPAHG